MFQLVAQARDNGIPRTSNGAYARTMLLLPDLLACFLTGQRVAEVTNASTTGLVDARLRTWSRPLLERLRTELGLDLDGVLPDVIEPGTVIGPVRPEALEVFGPDGAPTPVIAVGSHDTASAVVAVPAQEPDFAYISCGTWSLVGLELDEPVLTLASQAANFTNELGVDHTVRYLKNVMGLWVLNEAVRAWRSQGLETSLPELDAAAAAAEPLRTVVDINDPAFYSPGDMAARIDDAARATGQPRPRDVGEYVRCINDSLALASPPRRAPGRRAVRTGGEGGAHGRRRHPQPAPVPAGRRRDRTAGPGGPRRGHRPGQHGRRRPRRRPDRGRAGGPAPSHPRFQPDHAVRPGPRHHPRLGGRRAQAPRLSRSD